MSIKRYLIGNPFPTDSVILEIPPEEGSLPGWSMGYTEEGAVTLSMPMKPETIVYGLGETLRGINKRGWLYTSNCSDDPHHWEDKHSLYAAHNFILVVNGKDCFGLYVDTPGIVDFDIGYSDIDNLSILIRDGEADLYLILDDQREEQSGTSADPEHLQNKLEKELESRENNLQHLREKLAAGRQDAQASLQHLRDKYTINRPAASAGTPADPALSEGAAEGTQTDESAENVTIPVPKPVSSARRIVREFRKLIGQSYIPPRWALGFGQSRWGYKSADDIREVVSEYEKARIPLDMMYLDIDYMERYKDFTVNQETFPDFEQFTEEMRSHGVRLIPIIDAGVKVEEGYSVYEEGVKEGYFCRKENGEYLTAAVWPGKVHFPDFLNEKARTWFGDQYRFLLDKGIEGFWNDMNEPAIFYTEDHLKEVFDEIDTYKGKNLDIQSFFDFKALIGEIDNNPEDYKRFYHDCNGTKIRHDKVHNLYGYNMTRAAGEAFGRICPEKRILMFSRASYIGMHRYGGIWTGDNRSWWSHILLNLQQMPGLNMCGFIYAGADMGGFGADATEDLLLRWTALAMFMPLMRNHSARGTRQQELYRFTKTGTSRNLLLLRYSLLPYLYSEMMKAILTDDMLMLPLSFEYPEDRRAAHTEDQLLVGESIMIAPVYQQNAEGRYVYLPEDMKLLRFRSPGDYDEEMLPAGDHYVSCGLSEVLIFLRKGHVLPMASIPSDEPFRGSKDLESLPLQYFTCEAKPGSYFLYKDDGIKPV